MRLKINFDLDLILKMVNEEGKMLKDVQEYYGCTRGQLNWFTRKHGLNFRNNENARKKHSHFMSGESNPTKGRKRTAKEMEGVIIANKKRAELYWDDKFKDGITYNQYAKICRGVVPKEIKKQTIKFEIEADHIFSVKDCWEHKIHPFYASCEGNVRLIPARENKIKGNKSLYDLETFLKTVGVQRLSKAQFNWKRVE